MIDIDALLTSAAEMAEWREELIEQFPHDQRNAIAATHLRALIRKLKTFEDAASLRRLTALYERLHPDFKKEACNVLDEHMRLIGFYVHPKSAKELIDWIIENLEWLVEGGTS